MLFWCGIGTEVKRDSKMTSFRIIVCTFDSGSLFNMHFNNANVYNGIIGVCVCISVLLLLIESL